MLPISHFYLLLVMEFDLDERGNRQLAKTIRADDEMVWDS
jgi:hypothetical protein